jgi:hypothetical protein
MPHARALPTALLFAVLAAAPAAVPAQVGEWEPLFTLGVEAIHMVHLPTGRVLVWAYNTAGGGTQTLVYDPGVDGGYGASSFRPEMGGHHGRGHDRRRSGSPLRPSYSVSSALFCAGHTGLADGRVLVAGGLGRASHGVALFDPFTETWSQAPSMDAGRFYPTLTTLPDGRVLAAGGSGGGAKLPEIYDPATNAWTTLSTAARNIHWYPRHFVLPDGRVSFVSSNRPKVPGILDVASGVWVDLPLGKVRGGQSVMYLPGKVLRAGTDVNTRFRASAEAAVADFDDPGPAFRAVAPMAFARTRNQLTLLPDGTVLATGGRNGQGNVFAAELWDPATETWTTLASMQDDRVYHSTALLLRDGRVLVAGGEPKKQTAQFFEPPYLFKGPRPVITTAPASVLYGSAFDVSTPSVASVAKVTLLRLGAVTHSFDESQRFLSLGFTPGIDLVTVQAPATANLAPPGYYMLFLVSSAGVPSVAEYVRVGAS